MKRRRKQTTKIATIAHFRKESCMACILDSIGDTHWDIFWFSLDLTLWKPKNVPTHVPNALQDSININLSRIFTLSKTTNIPTQRSIFILFKVEWIYAYYSMILLVKHVKDIILMRKKAKLFSSIGVDIMDMYNTTLVTLGTVTLRLPWHFPASTTT